MKKLLFVAKDRARICLKKIANDALSFFVSNVASSGSGITIIEACKFTRIKLQFLIL